MIKRVQAFKKRAREDDGDVPFDDSSSESEPESTEGAPQEDSDEEEESEEVGEEELTFEEPQTVEDATQNPIYLSGAAFSCVVCPGRVLKHERMVKEHIESAAHKRRMKAFCKLGEKNDVPKDVVDKMNTTNNAKLSASGGKGKPSAGSTVSTGNRKQRRKSLKMQRID